MEGILRLNNILDSKPLCSILHPFRRLIHRHQVQHCEARTEKESISVFGYGNVSSYTQRMIPDDSGADVLASAVS